jgi:hypothetical protein
MKAVSKFFLLVFVLLGVSCSDSVKDTVTYTANVPVYMSQDEFNATTKVAATRPLKNPGKICLYGNYLFINEINEGIHVIDNSDPSSPQHVAFIEILGNIDVAAKDGILYADNLTDILLFDITDPRAPKLKFRFQGAFEGVLPATGNDLPISKIEPVDKVIAGWTQEEITEDTMYYYPRYDYYAMKVSAPSPWAVNVVQPGVNITGVNSSTSRFAIVDNYLYALYIENFIAPTYSAFAGPVGKLKIFNIENGRIELMNFVNVSTAVETIFAQKEHLFLGMSNGMQIYSIADPVNPSPLSTVWHFLDSDGLYQYSYANAQLQRLSVVPEEKEML